MFAERSKQSQEFLIRLWRNRAVNVGTRVLILAAIVWWVARRLDLAEAANLVRSPQPWALLGMIGCGVLFGIIGGIKVWTLLRALAQVSLQRTVVYFFVASSIGAFTPAALGDFSLAAFLKRENVPVHDGLAIVLVDRLVSVSLYVLVFTPLTLTFLIRSATLMWVPVLYLAVVGIALGLNARARVRGWIRENIVERFVPRTLGFLSTTSRLVRLYPWAMAGNVGVGLVRGVVGGMVVWMALLAVGTSAELLPAIAATNTLAVINVLPISFGGFGVYEGGGVLLFEAFGMEAVHVLAALLLQRIYVLASSTLILVIATIVLVWQRRQARVAREVRAI